MVQNVYGVSVPLRGSNFSDRTVWASMEVYWDVPRYIRVCPSEGGSHLCWHLQSASHVFYQERPKKSRILHEISFFKIDFCWTRMDVLSACIYRHCMYIMPVDNRRCHWMDTQEQEFQKVANHVGAGN